MKRELTDEERFERLPKWAQYRIRALESENGRLHEMFDEHKPSNTCISNYTMPDKYLPDNERIRFYLSDPEGPYGRRRYVEARVYGGRLNLMGSDTLIVRPHVTNVVNLEVEDR